MKKGRKPKFEESELGRNSFLLNLKIPVNKVKMHGQWEKDKDGIVLPLEVEVENEGSCRVYSGGGRRLEMVKLSARAKELYLWLIYEAEPTKDYLWINRVRYMEECRVKAYNTYRDAVRELHVKEFICPTAVTGVYWINPHYFFNGSRVNKFPDKIVKK